MLVANGLALPTEDWSRRLGITTFAITHALAEGLTMQEVVDAYESRPVPAPQTPPPNPILQQGTPSGPLLQTPGGSYTFRTLCAQCADQAKNYYDLAHTAHKSQMRLEAQARERAWNDEMFNFVNLPDAQETSAQPAQPVLQQKYRTD